MSNEYNKKDDLESTISFDSEMSSVYSKNDTKEDDNDIGSSDNDTE